MKYNSIFPIIALSLGLPALGSQEQITPVPGQQQTAEQAELQEDAQITRGQLANGVNYIIRPTAEPQGRASVRLFVNTGSLDEEEHEKGIAHLIEHLVFNGSRNFKRGELIPAMQKLGLGFGGDANAYTSLLETVYMLDLPNLKDETVDFAFTILRDFADGATLEDSAIEHERGIVRSELYARDSATYRASLAMLRHAAPGTRLPDYLPIGVEKVIMEAPCDVFRNFYKKHYVARNMTVVVTGDFSPGTALKWVDKYFGSMENNVPAARIAPGQPDYSTPADIVVQNPENALMNVAMMISTPWVEKPDTLAQRIEDLPLELACAMLNRRLGRMAREEHCPFQNAGVSQEEMYTTVEMFDLGVAAATDKWQQAFEAALLELRRACIYGFAPGELAELIASTRAAFDRQQSSWDTVDAAGMASRLIGALSDREKMTTPAEDKRAFETALARITATPDLCRQALEKAFDSARARLILTGAEVSEITGADLRNLFNKVMEQEVTPPVVEELPPFAYENPGDAGHIEKQALIEDLGITTLTLSNGIRVNLKPVDFSKGSISIQALIDGGSLRLAHTPGLATMASQVMRMGGLEAHDLTELEKIMAGRNVGVHFGMSSDRFSMSGSTTAADFELQCKLLAAAILHPGYRTDGEIQLFRQLPAIYKRYETTPNGAFNTQAPRAMYGNDARFTTPERHQVEACSTAQVKDALTPWLQKGAMEVSIVGDFDVATVLPILERTLGAMPARNREFTQLSDEETSVSQVKWGMRTFLPYQTDLDKTIVTQIRPCGDGTDQQRVRRLSVLTTIVREKLFDGIRAQLGETYSPSVRLNTHSTLKNAATITTASAGVIGNRTKVNTAMDAILIDLGQGKITQADLDCALRPYISRTQKSLRTMGYWEGALSRLQSDARQLPWMRNLVEDVQSITLEEIQQLAREIFAPQDTTNYFFTMPAAEVEKLTQPEQEPAEENEYSIITTATTMADPAWAEVCETLKKKHNGARIHILGELTKDTLVPALRSASARYAACVLRPQEVGRETVNNLHRATRRVDDDPWGDCIWGIITGYTAADALRIAQAEEPLTIKRLLATTNIDHNRFEHSCCITDWTEAPVREQSGYTEPTTTTYAADENDPLLNIFADQLSTKSPQLVISSSHATPFNLEMPFSRGLIFSHGNRFHKLEKKELPQFVGPTVREAMDGQEDKVAALAATKPAIEPDSTPRVWLAAGNCLFGQVNHSPNSMCVTALSAYNCNQLVGYTVPSWYGEGGWGTMGLFFGNTAGTSLAEAWYLNNQFILNRTMQIDPALLSVQFNDERFSPAALIPQLFKARVKLNRAPAKDYLGLVHDRDVVAFFGDPAWRAQLDESHSQSPFSISWNGAKEFTITARQDTDSRCGIWFPTAETGSNATGCNAPAAVFTDDFILFPSLQLKKGESLTVKIQ